MFSRVFRMTQALRYVRRLSAVTRIQRTRWACLAHQLFVGYNLHCPFIYHEQANYVGIAEHFAG